MARSKNYHHGDLRNALLHAALTMVEETGLEHLSLRKVAAGVGVSHAAPEHHFPSMRHLHNAMAVWGFEAFFRSIADELEKSPADGQEMLRAARRGYLSFAKAHPNVLRLMFNSGLLDWEAEDLCRAAEAAYLQLIETVTPAAEHLGLKSAAERQSLAGLVWSQIHGEALLVIDRKIPEPGVAEAASKPLDMASLIFGTFGRRAG